MDVLQPQLIWVEGRCYRKNHNNTIPQEPDSHKDIDESFNQENRWNDEYEGNCEDQPEDERDVEELPGGRFRVLLPVAQDFYGKIIGFKGQAKKRLELETKTRIFVPNADGFITVEGFDKSSVCSACLRVELLVASMRQKLSITHFLCLPLNHSEAKNAFLQFKERVLKACSQSRGVEESIFGKPDKLHLTLCTLVLLNNRERDLASNILKDAEEDIKAIVGETPLRVRIEGLEYMNDDPSEVDVLYAKVTCDDNSDRLQELGDFVVNLFSQSGVMPKQFDRLKLHMTLLNTLYAHKNATDEPHSGHNRRQDRETFDARQIIKSFGDHFFGCMEIRSIDVSQLHAVAKDGFYASSARLSLL